MTTTESRGARDAALKLDETKSNASLGGVSRQGSADGSLRAEHRFGNCKKENQVVEQR